MSNTTLILRNFLFFSVLESLELQIAEPSLFTQHTVFIFIWCVLYFSKNCSGFSFTEDENGYARNEKDVSRDLYNALTQFFTMFPKMQSRDFYIAGQSYGGMSLFEQYMFCAMCVM